MKSESVVDKLEKWFDKIDRRRELVIADKENKLADLFHSWLEQEYEVKVAESKVDLKDKVDHSTDCILIDRYFANNTEDVITELKLAYPETSIVLLTGVEPENDRAELDIDGYIVKPVDRKELVEKVEEELSKLNDEWKVIDE
jgi:response regulator RpfG family c-di-GMP phosphodiesterase